MKNIIPDELLYKLVDGSKTTPFRAVIDNAVSMRFRSSHYLSSIWLGDCITLDLLLNDKITPHSADGIITSIRRKHRSLYTTVDSAYFPVSDRFDEYSQHILGDKYNSVRALGMRTVNFIVYVISLDLSNARKFDKYEIIYSALDYEELQSYRESLFGGQRSSAIVTPVSPSP